MDKYAVTVDEMLTKQKVKGVEMMANYLAGEISTLGCYRTTF